MKENRDKFLTEAMGLCWHKSQLHVHLSEIPICIYCGRDMQINLNPDYSTWQGFGTLWEWAIKQEWWMEFWVKEGQFYKNSVAKVPVAIWNDLINPDRFSDALYKFLTERENETSRR